MTRKKKLPDNEQGRHLFKTDADPAVFRASMGLLEGKAWVINLYPRASVRGDYVWIIWQGNNLKDIEKAIHSGGYLKEMDLNDACRAALNILIKERPET